MDSDSVEHGKESQSEDLQSDSHALHALHLHDNIVSKAGGLWLGCIVERGKESKSEDLQSDSHRRGRDEGFGRVNCNNSQKNKQIIIKKN